MAGTNFTVSLIGNRAIEQSFARVEAEFKKERRKAMVRVLSGLDKEIKKNIRAKFRKQRGSLLKTTKKIDNSQAAGISGTIGPRTGYASVFEEGKTIRPTKAQYLRIPLPGTDRRARSDTFVTRSKRGNLIVFRRGLEARPVAVLVKSTKMPKRPFLAPALRARQSSIVEEFGDAYIAAVK